MVLTTIAVIIYFSFFKKEDVTTPISNVSNTPFNPFGVQRNPDGTLTSPRATSTPISTSTEVIPLPKLRLISADPVAGFIASSTSGSSTIIRYVERGRGHVYETKTDGAEVNKIINKTAPNVYEATWLQNGKDYLIRYMENDDVKEKISSRIVSLEKARTSSTSESLYNSRVVYIEDGADSIVPSNDLKDPSFLYSLSDASGVNLYKNNIQLSKVEKIFSTPYKYWNVFWPEKDTLLMANKPSAYGPGHSYSYNLTNKTLTPIVSGTALEILPNKNNLNLAFSEIKNGRYILSVIDTKTGKISETPLQTMASKCVWGNRDSLTIYCAVPIEFPSGIYPEDWFRGLVGLNDKIWKYDIETDAIDIVGNPRELSGRSIDVINMSIDPKDQYLLFQNKDDLSLWSLEIK